jgi:hypothetical protein
VVYLYQAATLWHNASGSRRAFGRPLAHGDKGGGMVPGGPNGQAGMHPDHGVDMPETSIFIKVLFRRLGCG